MEPDDQHHEAAKSLSPTARGYAEPGETYGGGAGLWPCTVTPAGPGGGAPAHRQDLIFLHTVPWSHLLRVGELRQEQGQGPCAAEVGAVPGRGRSGPGRSRQGELPASAGPPPRAQLPGQQGPPPHQHGKGSRPPGPSPVNPPRGAPFLRRRELVVADVDEDAGHPGVEKVPAPAAFSAGQPRYTPPRPPRPGPPQGL